MRDEWKLKGGWRIKPKLNGDPEYAKYVKRVADEQRKANPEIYNRPKPIKPEGMSQEDWIMSMQAPSTKDLLEKHKDPNYKRDWTAPLPDNVLANPEAKTKDELIGKRDLGIDEISHFEAVRRRPKNSLGQSELSSTSKESRERAAHNFLVSPPALLTEDEIQGVTNLTKPVEAIPATAPASEWRDISVWRAIYHFCTGNKVRRVKKDGGGWQQS